MKETNPLTRQLAPLIIFIVLIIVLTLVIRGSRLPEETEKDPSRTGALAMKLSPFSYQPPAVPAPAPAAPADLQLPEPDAVVSTATRDSAAGQYARAEDQLRTALLFYPRDRRILSLLGTVLYLQRKYPDAEGIFRLMTQLDPDDTFAYSNLGAALAGQNRFQEAIVSVRQAWQREPDSPAAALNLSGLYSLNGDTAEALDFFRKAYEKLGENILPLSYNSNFDNIRREKDFIKIVREAESLRSARKEGKQP